MKAGRVASVLLVSVLAIWLLFRFCMTDGDKAAVLLLWALVGWATLRYGD